jgi:hypothetical protein
VCVRQVEECLLPGVSRVRSSPAGDTPVTSVDPRLTRQARHTPQYSTWTVDPCRDCGRAAEEVLCEACESRRFAVSYESAGEGGMPVGGTNGFKLCDVGEGWLAVGGIAYGSFPLAVEWWDGQTHHHVGELRRDRSMEEDALLDGSATPVQYRAWAAKVLENVYWDLDNEEVREVVRLFAPDELDD